ncbi:hypothetical protein G6F66_015423 [Rhizopus arrhizus]|nr:hypothetical protein G6F66_015423 [Rhizopus arrhizus]
MATIPNPNPDKPCTNPAAMAPTTTNTYSESIYALHPDHVPGPPRRETILERSRMDAAPSAASSATPRQTQPRSHRSATGPAPGRPRCAHGTPPTTRPGRSPVRTALRWTWPRAASSASCPARR